MTRPLTERDVARHRYYVARNQALRSGAPVPEWTNKKPGFAPRPAEEHFFAKVDRDAPNGCWEWTGALSSGYGSMRVTNPRRSVLAHRVAYELLVGPIAEGLQIDHLCRNRRCVNPAHLEAVTPLENNRRSDSPSAKRRRQTHCQHGHEFTPENTLLSKLGWRSCRTCEASRSHIRIHPTRGDRWRHDVSEIRALARGEVSW